LALDESAVATGPEIFMAQCFACHDAKGQGREGLGPNLTDKYWVHGGAPTDIHATVTNGVPTTGMPPWAPILGETAVNQVVAYILTIRNTDVPGKGPEGDLWEPGGAVADDTGGPRDTDDGP
jgi:cytochrome c oxidase cbb3-type subunit 3